MPIGCEMTYANRDHADKSAYRRQRWLPSRDKWAVLAWCAAYTLVIAVIDWLARGMP